MKTVFTCALAVFTLYLSVNTATAGDDDDERKREKVRGTSHSLFIQDDFLGLSQGLIVRDVAISGTFEITVGSVIRTGRVTFPHLLAVHLDFSDPNGPTFVEGRVTGATAWFFDDGVVCEGARAGDFDETGRGLVTTGKYACTDGTVLKLKVRDTDVDPGVSVTAAIKGKLIYPKDDD